MLRSLASIRCLTGYRGAPPATSRAVEEVVLRVSAMVDAHHEIAELDLNPVVADPGRCGDRRREGEGREQATDATLAERPGAPRRARELSSA